MSCILLVNVLWNIKLGGLCTIFWHGMTMIDFLFRVQQSVCICLVAAWVRLAGVATFCLQTYLEASQRPTLFLRIWEPMPSNLDRKTITFGLFWRTFARPLLNTKPIHKCFSKFFLWCFSSLDNVGRPIWCTLEAKWSSVTSSSGQKVRRGLRNGKAG